MSAHHDLSQPADLIAYLANTPFASNSVTALTGGNANYIFRLNLITPHEGHSTLVLKHGTANTPTGVPVDIGRQAVERQCLERVKRWLPADSLVTVATVHHYDPEAHVIIMEDCGQHSQNLKKFMIENEVPAALAMQIGAALGKFLGELHQWGRGNTELLDAVEGNQWSRNVAAFITYGRLTSTLSGADDLAVLDNPLLEISAQDMEAIASLSEKKTKAIKTTRETLAHGDFWTGNIIVDLDEGQSPPKLKRLTVVDWEIARPGIPGLDVGQFCAEMQSIKWFYPNRASSSKALMDCFLKSYQQSSSTDGDLVRNAVMHLGAHFVAWTPRVWAEVSRDITREMVLEGVRYLVEGYQGSEEWLAGSVFSPLVSSSLS